MKKKEHTLWVEKYRPKTLDDYIGNDHIKSKVKQYIETNDPPHLLLYGKPGVGKCLDFDEEIIVEIDVSDDEYDILKCFEIK